VGKPLAVNEIRIASDGEILVRGPGVFQGYCGEAPPSDRFTSDGFFETGDCGYFDNDGFLFLTGRKSEIIKTSTGRRVAPSAIELVYSASPYVDQVIVLGNGRPYLVALVSLNQKAIAEAAGSAKLQPAVRELITHDFADRGAQLAIHERIQDFAILPRALTINDGELTSTLKYRRAQIEQKYRDVIEQMYEIKS